MKHSPSAKAYSPVRIRKLEITTLASVKNMHRSDFMGKKKTVRKYELKQRIERLEKANSYLEGQLSSTAHDIFKEILSQVKNQVDPHIARKEFLGMTRDVSCGYGCS